MTAYFPTASTGAGCAAVMAGSASAHTAHLTSLSHFSKTRLSLKAANLSLRTVRYPVRHDPGDTNLRLFSYQVKAKPLP